MWRPLAKNVAAEVQTVTTYIDKKGVKRVVGTSELKGTQAYPRDFGKRAAEVVLNERVVRRRLSVVSLAELSGILDMCSDDPWDDAELAQVIKDLEALHP